MGNGAQIIHPASVADFNALLQNSTFVVVDFFADWCPPCKAIDPLFAKLASTSTVPGHLAFASISVDDVPDVAMEYGVTTMPTFLFFASGNLASVDTNGAVKASTNPGAMMEQDRVKGIKGVDPRALVAVVQALKRAAEARARADTSKKSAQNGETKASSEDTPAQEKKATEEKEPTDTRNGPADKEEKEEKEDKTVSGSYTMGSTGEKRADWKMSLGA